MRLGSLFDGSGGFPLAGVLNGIRPVWASEIEPFPIRVTKARFPRMKHLGSVTDIDGAKIEPVDVITFGSPCQDLSVAGKQAGLHEGKRSSLFFEAIRIIKEMRNGTANEFPRFAVWENVTGAFSSNGGEDFRAVLEALCNVRGGANISIPMPPKGKWLSAGCVVGDGYSVAWKTYDAQDWGVPQRRKRIYLVADFGSERAGEILFEREGLRWDTAQRREAREGASGDAEGGVGGSRDTVPIAGFCINESSRTRSIGWALNQSPTLTASDRGQGLCYASRRNGTRRADTAWRNVARCRSLGEYAMDGTTSTQKARDYKGGTVDVVLEKKPPRKYIVRRLTPTECERLQGFPGWWTDGVDGSDSAKYKMWGNGIALPCAEDVMRRIKRAYERMDSTP